MDHDNSRVAGVCQQWGFNGANYNVGKWGSTQGQERSYLAPAFAVRSFYHWLLDPVQSRCECDEEKVGVSSGGFWKVFVR